MKSDQELFNDLMYYTLAHPDPAFIHQNVVDAYTAQTADNATKPIAVAFALLGLYLHVEQNFTGRQVQKAHMQLARQRKTWPRLPLPKERGAVVVAQVVAAPPGPQRDAMIRDWCVSVWSAWRDSRNEIVNLVRTELGIG
jgi:Family of unknown function (DUF5946)